VNSNANSAKNPPPIPEHRRAVYEYYQLTFDEVGCPMKRTELGDVFHPILAPYLISDYLSLFNKSGDRSFLDYAVVIAGHALKRAEHRGNALIFVYSPNTGLSNVPTAFYSALTQAWYIKVFCALERHLPGEYGETIRQLFVSLMIPSDQSGVLMKKEYGWVVEEYPHEPAFYTLNGWLTVLRWIVQSRKMLDCLEIPYAEFLERNLDAVEYLLPLYDASFCRNSRYQLTGYTRIKMVFDRKVAAQCLEFEIEIPREGRFPGVVDGANESRWQNHLERSGPRFLQFNVLLSLISKPQPNVFRARVKVNEVCTAKVLLAQGSYRPDASGIPTESWMELATISLQPNSEENIDCAIPFDDVDLFAYPTNFKKRIGGVSYNGYHFVHIVDLAELYQYSGRNSLKAVAKKWLASIDEWAQLPCLAGGEYSLQSHIYGDDFARIVGRLLDSQGDVQ